ncbi:aldo/keto reductase [Nitratireductor sp. ZSWI3]|uniref:aldo/keto reductase n=1 Tax=Nitratireductor sp. ZSWI3 TaxID=2966359 RepID=UPI00214F8BFD|nr:aldo/keto reductase [Nitratireductor sp. ZSWI3]MCR4265027.1 aldo/keto reductase [Nitratireductor sp. ZSWI3]
MKYRTLGRSGLLVSELCLGAMTFGGGGVWDQIGAVDGHGAKELLAAALDAGVNLVDTADYYSLGQSETMLGAALAALNVPRDRVLIATKGRLRMGDGPNDVGSSRHHLIQAAEASLKRLGTDYIDLYQLHGFDHVTPIEESVRALEDLIRAGKVRYIGFCNFPAWEAMKAMAVCEHLRTNRFISTQVYYNPGLRDFERELQPFCLDQGVGALVWSPLAGGLLTGKYRKNGSGRRNAFDFPPVNGRVLDELLAVLDMIATRRDVTVAQVSLAWTLARAGISSVILGARSVSQLQETLRATELVLDETDMAAIDAATPLPPVYPEWMVERQKNDRLPGATAGLIPLKAGENE